MAIPEVFWAHIYQNIFKLSFPLEG